MRKTIRVCKKIFALVLAVIVISSTIFTGAIDITAYACDVNKIDYWDGTMASAFASGTGSETDPYIIETAEQLALCCLGQNPSTSSGKYYKVADSIKIFVMQPENIINLETLMALSSAEETKNYFDGLSGILNWQSKFNYRSFNGNFDGNGATVYGLYADGVAANMEDVGLFPQYDGGYVNGIRRITNICKNIAVKNSFFITKRRMGAIAGAAYGTAYGAKFDGKVTIDNCAVINCYMTGTGINSYYLEQGIVAGGGYTDIIELNNILVKGTYAYNTEQNRNINIIGSGSTKEIGYKYTNSVSNSIFLGVAPYGKDYYVTQLHEPYLYSNVVTDQPSCQVELLTPNSSNWSKIITYDESQIKSVTETGFDFQMASTNLDWENIWFMSNDGPELRAFHGELTLETTNKTHIFKCSDCGITSYGGVSEHNFVLVGDTVTGDGNDIYRCSICGYTCQHSEQSAPIYDAGDCVTQSGVYVKCKFCEWYLATNLCEAPGHNLSYFSVEYGECEENGYSEYWQCSICDKKFSTDNNFAPMRDSIEISGKYEHNKHGYKADGVNGHYVSCPTCGYELYEINSHIFKNGKCSICGWRCDKHSLIGGDVVQQVSDKNPELTEQICTVCGHKSVKITKDALNPDADIDIIYPITPSYDSDYIDSSEPDISYEAVDYTKKTVTDNFTAFATDFIINANTKGNGTAANPYIIKTANQFAAVVTGTLYDANGNYIDTEGLYFRIADNVYGFNLNNTNSTLDFSSDNLTASQVENELTDAQVLDGLIWENTSGIPFKGNFDGNGACVYGLKGEVTYKYNTYSGLFPLVGGNVTLKNLTVKNCYFIGNSASALFGYNQNPGKISTYNTKHNLYNCQVYNNVIVSNYERYDAIQKAGVLIGQSAWPTESCMVVNDCLVYGNIAKHIQNDDYSSERNIIYGLVGNLHRNGSLSINNSIIMDCAPHALYYGSNAHLTSSYNNLYTNAIGIPWENIDFDYNQNRIKYVYNYTVYDTTPNVGFYHYDKDGVCLTNGGYGYNKELTDSVVYINTPNEIKNSTNLDGIDVERWTYNIYGYPTPKIYKVREYSAGTNWSGEQAVQFGDGDGSKTSPYTIATAEELALMLMNPVSDAYYKLIADININDTSLPNWTDNARKWFTSNDVPVFEGILDGNGHTVSGIYYDGNQSGKYGGLIPVLGSGGCVKNITIKNSQFGSTCGTVFGAVTGNVADSGKKRSNISGITVENTVDFIGNVVYSGIVGNVGFAAVSLNDNISFVGGIVGNVNGKIYVKRCVSIDSHPFGNMKEYDIQNVYTNISDKKIDGVTVVDKSYMIGSDASRYMSGLNFPTSWKVVQNDYPTPTGVDASIEGVVGEVWSGAIATKFASGNGTKDDPYIIETAEQLAYFVYNGLKGPYVNIAEGQKPTEEQIATNLASIKYVKLGADIYLNDVNSILWNEHTGCINWFTHRTTKSYGNMSHINFDGDGHIIHGLFYDCTKSTEDYVRVALFPMLSAYSTIENVGLSNVYLNGRSDNNYPYNDAMAGFVGYNDDFDKYLQLDSRDGEANRKKLADPTYAYTDMATKFNNCFIDHNSYISGSYTGGFIALPYSVPILKNCIFTGSLGGHSDIYYTGVFTGMDTTYGTQLIECISLPNTFNNAIGGSTGATWRSNVDYWVTTVDDVYYFSTDKQDGGAFTRISTTEMCVGDNAKTNMPGLDWNNIWTTVADGTPMLKVFAKHRPLAELEIYSNKEYKYFSGTNDEFIYYIENDEVTIKGLHSFIGGDLVIPDEINGYPVTKILDNAFIDCDNITSVTIPDSVKTIGEQAFQDCSNLLTVNFGNGVKNINNFAFAYCENLVEVSLPRSVKYIGIQAFDYCNSIKRFTVSEDNAYYSSDKYGVLFNKNKTELINYPISSDTTSYVIPDTVVYVRSFSYCANLKEITIPSSVENIKDISISAFRYCDSLERIIVDDNSEYYCTDSYGVLFNKDKTTLIAMPAKSSVTNYDIPHSVNEIEYYAFYNCINLKNVTIPNNITKLNGYIFSGCSNLENILIPDSITEIGPCLFQRCTSLKNITIPKNVSIINSYGLFWNSTALEKIDVHPDNAYFTCDENGVLFNKDKSKLIFVPANNDIKDYVIPDSVTSIESGAFTQSTFNTLTISENITQLNGNILEAISVNKFIVDENNQYLSTDENGVLFNKDKTTLIRFPANSDITRYVVPSGVKTIGLGAFDSCINLKNIIVSNGVEYIGDWAFSKCYNLTSITLPGTLHSIGSRILIYSDNCYNIWYEGNEEQRNNISIDGSSSYSKNNYITANWHFNVCKTDDHIYSSDNDSTCDKCGWKRFDCVFGDVNDDSEINNKDLGILMQYLNGWDVQINVDAADVNTDGDVNNKDYGILMQYLNGWDVKLG